MVKWTTRSGLAAAGAVALAGCSASGADEAARGGPASQGRVEVAGVMTDEGIECPAMRGDDGELYTLAGAARGFPPGTRVVVHGTVAELSTCMQGTTLVVERIEAR